MRLIFQKMIRTGSWKLIEPSKLDPYECLTLNKPDDVIDFIEFKNKKPKGALYEYAIAGTLHLDHVADLRHSPQGNAKLDRTVFQLSRALGEPQVKIQEQLDRLLERHEGEWKSFIHSLGPNSFVANWALRGKKHVA